MGKYFIVYSKPDDYGACNTELVQTTLRNAKQYYNLKKVPDEHAEILKEYFDFVPEAEEKERTDEQRYYGDEE